MQCVVIIEVGKCFLGEKRGTDNRRYIVSYVYIY